MTQTAKHAIVIGGSMAGLTAARSLSDHFQRVTVIERDKLPDGPEFRGGVPQGRHLHALLARGQEILERMFPGLDRDLDEIGAPDYQWGIDAAWLTAGGWIKRADMGIKTKLVSRPALEFLVRRRLAMRDNVSFMPEHSVEGLLADRGHISVTGVQVESRLDHITRELEADLVVDASGRNSKTGEWLKAIGYSAPEESTVYAYIGYATRVYEKPEGRHDWKLLFLTARPTQGITRGGAIFEVEGNRWLAMVGGLNRDYPPTDEEGYLAFAKSLASPALYEAIREAKPLSPVYGYRYDGNRWRHYERLKRRPERLLVMGDALCGFNPLYGQGITVAALEAEILGQLLTANNGQDLDGFAGRFQRAIARPLQTAWLLATGEDMRYPGTDGPKPGFAARLVQRYVDRVLVAMGNDMVVSRAFLEVSNLRKPPTSLFAPDILLRVLRNGQPVAEQELARPPARPVLATQ